MARIDSIAALEALYPPASENSLRKVAHSLTPTYRAWIAASRFCLVSTVGPEGTDCSPRGDRGPVVRMRGDRTLLLPDWPGNNRIDNSDLNLPPLCACSSSHLALHSHHFSAAIAGLPKCDSCTYRVFE